MLTLYGFPMSTATRRVALVLHEKKVPFEFVAVDGTTFEQKSPAYLAKNPFGLVPYIDDDGFVLFESRAICRYIATKWVNQGTPLIPTDPKNLAIFEQAVFIEACNFEPFARTAVFEKVFKPARGLGDTNEGIFTDAVKTLRSKLEGYEAILSKSQYLAGDAITLADLFHLPFGSLLPKTGEEFFSDRHYFSKWFNELSNRPAWLAVKDGVKSTSSH